ncbi:MAG: dihydrofolate reductase family protein [Candidatus Levyibacteriota bacterium]
MAKLFLFMMVSLDGYFEGPEHDLSWHNVDREFVDFAIEQTGQVGTLLFGRRTYELMENFWPSSQAQDDPETAKLMNNTPKMVFSTTLEKVHETKTWKHVTLVKEVNVEQINKLKEESAKDLAVFGSNGLAVSLLELGLFDELRIMINPVVIEKGTPLFYGLKEKKKFTLKNTKVFNSGNILLTYTT